MTEEGSEFSFIGVRGFFLKKIEFVPLNRRLGLMASIAALDAMKKTYPTDSGQARLVSIFRWLPKKKKKRTFFGGR